MHDRLTPAQTRNRLLAALPADVLSQILPKFRRVTLAVREVLINSERPIEAVYFVESGFVSMVETLADGAHAEVGIVGCEGMVGLPLILGVDSAYEEAFVQAEGTALQMTAGVFRQIIRETPILQNLLFRYIEAMRAQTSQIAACNGAHGLEQRLARWLLKAHDRLETDEFPLTQELLAIMLCVHRPSVTVVAGALQRAGIIRYGRGRIAVLDRVALEEAACDCYSAGRRRFERLLGSPEPTGH